jgi:hypothetical protein
MKRADGPRVPTASAVAAACGALAVLAVFTLAGMAAGSGPWASGRTSAATVPVAPATPQTTQQPRQVEATATPSPPGRQIEGSEISGYLVFGLLALVGLGLLALLARRLQAARWALRRAGRSPHASTSPEVAPTAETLPDAVERALQVVVSPDAREAVVRAWLLLGEAAAAAGTPARPAETAAEYAARLAEAHRLPVSSLQRLAELYREARFSAHPVRPDQQALARAELTTLRSALVGGDRRSAP